jgi:hypothetical protein
VGSGGEGGIREVRVELGARYRYPAWGILADFRVGLGAKWDRCKRCYLVGSGEVWGFLSVGERGVPSLKGLAMCSGLTPDLRPGLMDECRPLKGAGGSIRAISRLRAHALFAIYFAGKFGDEIQERAPAELTGHGAAAFGEGASGAGFPGGR